MVVFVEYYLHTRKGTVRRIGKLHIDIILLRRYTWQPYRGEQQSLWDHSFTISKCKALLFRRKMVASKIVSLVIYPRLYLSEFTPL